MTSISKIIINICITLLFVFPLTFMTWKTIHQGYTFNDTIASFQYNIEFRFDLFPSRQDSLKLHFYLPSNDSRQLIKNENAEAKALDLNISNDEYGRLASLRGEIQQKRISFSFKYQGKGESYKISDSIRIVDVSTWNESKQLLGNELKKVFYNSNKDPEIFREKILYLGLEIRKVDGFNLSLNENQFISWSEIKIGNQWIPFDVKNQFFAEIPAYYLRLAGNPLNSQINGANIPYSFKLKSKRESIIDPTLIQKLENQKYNAVAIIEIFDQNGLSPEMLKIILLIPIAALIIGVFRNVIGLSTFGIFLPMLLAIAFLKTGFIWGVLAYLIIIGIVSIIHFPLERLGLLSIPKMSIILTLIVAVFLFIAVLSNVLDLEVLTYVTLFPIIIVTVSAERFAKTINEKSYKEASLITLKTIIVAGITYLIFTSVTLESILISFPELSLIILGINLLLGRWVGLRVSELHRFKSLQKA
jgi:hypothetical protein